MNIFNLLYIYGNVHEFYLKFVYLHYFTDDKLVTSLMTFISLTKNKQQYYASLKSVFHSNMIYQKYSFPDQITQTFAFYTPYNYHIALNFTKHC